MTTTLQIQEISCQQVMLADASIFSIQYTDMPLKFAGALSAKQLLLSYLGYIKKCTLALIQPVLLEGGVEFRLLGTRLSLISFLPPEYGEGSVTLHISGGFLVQPRQCDRGELRFGVENLPESVRISLRLSDFCPLILGGHAPSFPRFWLYRLTQALIHRLVTIRFLTLVYRDLAGKSAAVSVVKVSVREGRPV